MWQAVPPSEYQTLVSMAKEYSAHMQKHDKSLLVRFYGLHKIQMRPTQEAMQFIVMCNMTEPTMVSGSTLQHPMQHPRQ